MIRSKFLVFSAFWLLALAYSNYVAAQKVDTSLISAIYAKDSLEVFIVMDGQADLAQWNEEWDKEVKGRFVFEELKTLADAHQESLISKLQALGVSHRPYFLVNAVWAVIDSLSLEVILRDPSVLQVLPNHNISTAEIEMVRAPSTDTSNWGIDDIAADKAWALGVTGRGVVVGGEDTGIDWDHESLQQSYRGSEEDGRVDHNYNWHDAIRRPNPLHGDDGFYPCGFDNHEPCDDNGHGTHTIGTVVGKTEELNIGVAPDAQWIGARNMDRGYGSMATYLECMEWFLAPTDLEGQNHRPDLAPDVVNNSWSCPEMEGCIPDNVFLLEEALHNMEKAGIFMAVSAGNSGRNGCGSISNAPARFKSAFAVGATDISENVASFSSRGVFIDDQDEVQVKPDVSAPGVNVFSALPGDNYASLNGTSMASPHVAGTVALMISANPDLRGKVADIRNILKTTSRKVNTTICASQMTTINSVFGHGIIDAYEAVLGALEYEATSNDAEPRVDSKLFSVHPNPVNDIIYIDQDLFSNRGFRLMNAQGVSVLNNILSREVDISGMPSGSYFLQDLATSHTLPVIILP